MPPSFLAVSSSRKTSGFGHVLTGFQLDLRRAGTTLRSTVFSHERSSAPRAAPSVTAPPSAFGAVVALLIATSLPAQSIPIVNHSFEDISGETPTNEFTFGPLNGWELYDPSNITNGGAGNTFFIGTLTPQPVGDGTYINFTNGAADGSRVGIAFNFSNSRGTGQYGMAQTLTATLQPHTSYSLQVDIGNIASGQSVAGDFYNLDGFPGYRVDLLAGGVVVASDDNSLAASIAEGAFGLSTVNFATGTSHAQMGQALGIRLVNLNLAAGMPEGSDLEVDFDNVRLTATAIPEPATWGWIGLLFGALAFLRRRPCRIPAEKSAAATKPAD